MLLSVSFMLLFPFGKARVWMSKGQRVKKDRKKDGKPYNV